MAPFFRPFGKTFKASTLASVQRGFVRALAAGPARLRPLNGFSSSRRAPSDGRAGRDRSGAFAEPKEDAQQRGDRSFPPLCARLLKLSSVSFLPTLSLLREVFSIPFVRSRVKTIDGWPEASVWSLGLLRVTFSFNSASLPFILSWSIDRGGRGGLKTFRVEKQGRTRSV